MSERRCEECGGPHHAKGLCKTCYMRTWGKEYRARPEARVALNAYRRDYRALRRLVQGAGTQIERPSVPLATRNERLSSGDTPWYTQTRCGPGETEKFFDSSTPSQAREICRGCLVRTACLIDDLLSPVRDEYGIRAGFGPVQRDRLAREVAAGADPLDVAMAAIDRQTKEITGGANPGRKPRFKRRGDSLPRSA